MHGQGQAILGNGKFASSLTMHNLAKKEAAPAMEPPVRVCSSNI